MSYLCMNSSLTPEFIESRPDIKWDFYFLSSNDTITCDFIEKHISKKWDWGHFSWNSNIDWKFVKRHLNRNWDWNDLSQFLDVTWEIVQKNPDMQFGGSGLVMNKGIMPETIVQHFTRSQLTKKHSGCMNKYEYTDELLSRNPNLSWDFISRNPDIRDISQIDWDWTRLARLSMTTLKIVKENFRKLNRHTLSINPNLTADFVINNRGKVKWHWDLLSANKFNKHRVISARNKQMKITYYRSILYICLADKLPTEMICYIANCSV